MSGHPVDVGSFIRMTFKGMYLLPSTMLPYMLLIFILLKGKKTY